MTTAGERDHPSEDFRAALRLRDNAAIRRRRDASRKPPPDTPVGVLDRSVAVLDAVEAGARSFSAIVEATGLTRTTTHRLIGSLEDHGFVFHVGSYGYALGPRLLGLAATAMRELPLRDLARPALERLARSSGESAQLFMRDGLRRVCVDGVQSEHELRTIVEIGASLPLDKGSAGKVLLAWATDRQATDLVRRAGLDRAIGVTRRKGWASSHGERQPGVASISAPVFGPGDRLVGAVSMSGPASRILPLRAKELAPAVVEAAGQIGDALGASVYQA